MDVGGDLTTFEFSRAAADPVDLGDVEPVANRDRSLFISEDFFVCAVPRGASVDDVTTAAASVTPSDVATIPSSFGQSGFSASTI